MDERLRALGAATTCPVAVILRGGKVLAGRRNYTPEKWKGLSVWTIPGGRCDEGETIEETLRREVAEEVGITDLQIEKYLGEVSGAKEGDTVPVFLCSTAQEPKLMELEKFSEWKWASFEEIADEFINPRLLELIKSRA